MLPRGWQFEFLSGLDVNTALTNLPLIWFVGYEPVTMSNLNVRMYTRAQENKLIKIVRLEKVELTKL